MQPNTKKMPSYRNCRSDQYMWDLWLLPVFGFLIAIIASLTGIGGGVFIVPVLTFLYEFLPANAAGTSLTVIIFTAMAAILNYARQRRIYWRTGLVLAVVTAPGAYLGAWLTTILSSRQLGLIFGFFLIFVGIYMGVDLNNLLRGNNKNKRPNQESDLELIRSGRTIAMGAGLSFFGGLASGLLGIGGGPTRCAYYDVCHGYVDTHSDCNVNVHNDFSARVQHYQANHIDLEIALLLALGAIFGAQVGAYMSKRVSGKDLRRIFAIVVIISGVNMILKYW